MFVYKQDNVSISDAEGFHVFITKQFGIIFGVKYFACRSGEYISVLFVCNGIVDCNKDSCDEDGCDRSSNISLQIKTFHYIPTSLQVKLNISRMCPPCFIMTMTGICQKDFSHSRKVSKPAKNNSYFVCVNGIKLDIIMKDDLVAASGQKLRMSQS